MHPSTFAPPTCGSSDGAACHPPLLLTASNHLPRWHHARFFFPTYCYKVYGTRDDRSNELITSVLMLCSGFALFFAAQRLKVKVISVSRHTLRKQGAMYTASKEPDETVSSRVALNAQNTPHVGVKYVYFEILWKSYPLHDFFPLRCAKLLEMG